MDISNVWATQVTTSAVVVYVMQKVKTAKWFPLVQEGRAALNRLVSVVAAFFTAVGISWTWSKDAATGTHTLVLAGIGFFAIAHGAWHWLNQFALQEMIYQGTANKPGVTTSAVGAIPAMVAPGGAVVMPPAPKP